MKRELLNKMVSDELDHIARGDRGSDQNALRMIYNMIRRKNLGRDPTTPRAESLRRAVEAIRQSSPDFVPQYDEGFFKP